MPRNNDTAKNEAPAVETAAPAEVAIQASPRRTDLPAEQIGRLVSRLSHPVVVDYDGGKLRITPRTETPPHIIKGLLGTLPAGVMFVRS